MILHTGHGHIIHHMPRQPSSPQPLHPLLLACVRAQHDSRSCIERSGVPSAMPRIHLKLSLVVIHWRWRRECLAQLPVSSVVAQDTVRHCKGRVVPWPNPRRWLAICSVIGLELELGVTRC